MSKVVKNFNLCCADKMEHFSHLMSGGEEGEFSIYGSLVNKMEGDTNRDANIFRLTDMEICGYNGTVTAHSAVLIPLSTMIARMTETITCCQNVSKIILGDINVDVIKMVLQLLYTGEIPRLNKKLTHDVGECLKLMGIRKDVLQRIEVESCSGQTQKASISDKVILVNQSNFRRKSSSLSSLDILDMTASEEIPDAFENRSPSDENHNYKSHPPNFSAADDLDTTTYSEHGDKLVNECQHCDFKSKYWSKLVRHSVFEHSGCEFTCSYCDYKAMKLTTVRTHEYHKHIGRGRVACVVCGFKTKNAADMSKHVNKEHSQGDEGVDTSINVNTKKRKRTKKY